MRLLLDENVPTAASRALRVAGHDVEHVAEGQSSLQDEHVLEHAVTTARVLVTFDRDFGMLVFSRRRPVPPGIVLLRWAPRSGEEIALALVELLGDTTMRWEGCFSVVESDRLRQRPLGSGRE